MDITVLLFADLCKNVIPANGEGLLYHRNFTFSRFQNQQFMCIYHVLHVVYMYAYHFFIDLITLPQLGGTFCIT